MGKKGYILSGAALLAALTLLAGCGKNNGTEDKNKDKPDTDPAQEIVLVQPEAADVPVDFETAQLMGIKINNVISATFIIGTFLAAIGSVLFFTNFPGVVPTAGAMPGLKAFVAAVFGGIGSVPGAVVGAFIIGICESVIKGLDTILMANGAITEQVGFATFSDAFTFVLLIVILVFKPTGLFGEKTTDKV